MADTLKRALLDPDRRQAVVADLNRLVDAEVSEKNGIAGMAVKGGYAVLNKINATFVRDAIDGMLDEFVAQAAPFYADFENSAGQNAGGTSLADYFAARSPEVANALLGVTDSRAGSSRRETVKKVYGKLRPQAQKHVEEALPRLAEVIETHVSAATRRS